MDGLASVALPRRPTTLSTPASVITSRRTRLEVRKNISRSLLNSMAPVIRAAFDNSSYDLRCKVGLSGVVAAVLELKPALVLLIPFVGKKRVED